MASITILWALGCSSKKSETKPAENTAVGFDKPEQLVAAYFAAQRARDATTLWNMHTENAQAKLERRLLDKVIDKSLRGPALLQATMTVKLPEMYKQEPKNIRVNVGSKFGRVLFDVGKQHCQFAVDRVGQKWQLGHYGFPCGPDELDKTTPKPEN